MGTRKTQEEIDAEIVELRMLVELSPQNARSIKIQIRVLKEAMSHDEVYDQFEGTDEFDDAHDIRMWRDGDNGGAKMSDQWRELL
jgi:hypothetical protein